MVVVLAVAISSFAAGGSVGAGSKYWERDSDDSS